MSGHGEKLTHKQERAIAALLVAPSVTAAVLQVRVNENTLLRWLKDPAFETAYRDARRAVVEQAIVQVQQYTGEAVATLREVMQDPEASASARVSAAKVMLDTAFKVVEVERSSRPRCSSSWAPPCGTPWRTSGSTSPAGI